jgi:CubicO group peptidase (beta-lactamase class C family)/predicted dienelactone hydrolase
LAAALTGIPPACAQAPLAWSGFANLAAPPDTMVTLPEPTGPHLVGTIAYHWVDDARDETATEEPGDRRQLIAQLWYPAAPAPDPAYAPYLPDLQAMRGALETSAESLPRRIAADLAVHARVRAHALIAPGVDEPASAPRYPVVVFSPGGNMSRHWHTALLQELASHGFVAVALSHPYVGWDVFPAGGFLKSIDWGLDANDQAEARASEARMADILASDVRLALERLTELDASDPGGRFTGRLALDRVGVAGHSRGGATVARSCATLEAIDACVILDNIGTDREVETGLPRPQLTIRRADWEASRVERLRDFLSSNAGEAWDVALAGASHFSFSDLPIVDPAHYESDIDPRRAHQIVSDLVRTFLDEHLRDDRTASLADAAARWPEVTAWTPATVRADPVVPSSESEAADRESRGWSRAALFGADSIAAEIGTAAWLLLEDGVLVWQWGDVARPYRAHSVRKSLLDALYGIHVARGDIDTLRTLGELGIDAVPALGPTERQARLADLLESRSGVYRKAAHESSGWDEVRPAAGSHAPGEHFFYSNWDFNVAGVAFELLTGRNLFAAFDREVAAPLGMKDFTPRSGGWRYDLDRSPHPAFVFRISARDLARFGLLYLREGRWEDRRILPDGWVDASTRRRSDVLHPRTGELLTGVGYGRLWWVAGPGGGPHGVELGAGSFWASGTGEQLLAVSPERGLVFVHREDTDRGDESVSGEELARLMRAILAAKSASPHG